MNIKKSLLKRGFLKIKVWQRPTLPPVIVVPSALMGLTSLFEMGRGGPQCYSHHKILIS